ncbi:MAG TPA: CHAT domain-containing protein [Desulfuromonadales bacterium]|nr:CHAT domain-containing protein [Desulfuromonadales bacterium]
MNITVPRIDSPGFFARLARLSAACLAAVALFSAAPASSAESPMVPAELAEGAASLRSGGFGASIPQLEAALQRLDAKNGAGRCDALLMLAQALQVTGQYRKALEHLNTADLLAKELRDKRRTASVAGAIGNVHIGLGNAEQAGKSLDEALALAREAGADDLTAAIQNNRGNLLISQKKNDEARVAYRESAALAEKSGNAARAAAATVNGATAAFRGDNYSEALALLQKAGSYKQPTDGSAAVSYTRINAGLLYTELSRKIPDQAEPLATQAYAEFNAALAAAKNAGDLRTESYAYGYMGKLYENNRRFEEALELTRRAQFAAQQVNASEALYRWHWQAGRIHASAGRIDTALVSYRHALRYLQAIREELSSCYANPESSYQKTASVVCTELVDLLLQRASQLKPGESQEPYLIEARDTLETLKVFELRDYFRDDCIDAATAVGKKLEAVSGRAAVVYPVFLPNRVELLVSFSGGLKRFTVPVGVDELNREITAFRRKLVKRTTGEYLPHAQKLYDWLIRPLEADLDAMKPETLVFVPAGQLRTVPMAALHDGARFLINRYPIAITPGLSLTDPRPVQRDHARMLSLGLTEARQGFVGLPYVSDELSAINKLFTGHTLINIQFSLANVEKELKKEQFSIVHIASHGHFGGDVDSTFILAFDEKFTMDRFGEYVGLFRFREEPLDLLTLSACETAAGDDRAALGLAGVAVRAGARSALATLWHINDPASFELITEFYTQLQKPSISRAAALQAAQLKLLDDIRYDHPGYWAPFLLINNWL